jgi:hypothetical protein
MRPRLTYGSETLVLLERDIENLETYYEELLRIVQHLPKSTSTAACYSLIGAVLIEDTIHQKALNLLGNIMSNSKELPRTQSLSSYRAHEAVCLGYIMRRKSLLNTE